VSHQPWVAVENTVRLQQDAEQVTKFLPIQISIGPMVPRRSNYLKPFFTDLCVSVTSFMIQPLRHMPKKRMKKGKEDRPLDAPIHRIARSPRGRRANSQDTLGHQEPEAIIIQFAIFPP